MIGNEKVFIIAEAGVNHNGRMEIAKKLVDAALWAGADAVKFQTWKTENVITKTAPKAEYQNNIIKDSVTQFDMLKELELGYGEFTVLKEYCDKVGIIFMSTADEYESAFFLNTLQDVFKIGSAELTDWPFLRKIAGFGKNVILSTGMGNLAEIESALNILYSSGLEKEKITILHANTEYPTPFEDVNLKAMQTIRDFLNVQVGYSDHTLGIEVPIAAVALGARVIEKHLTLDRSMTGPDHSASIEPAEFKAMVESIRNIEKAIGNGVKLPSNSEIKNIPFVRKSIVAKTSIKTGEKFTENNLTVKRPGKGISPIYWDKIVGQVAERDYDTDEFIEVSRLSLTK